MTSDPTPDRAKPPKQMQGVAGATEDGRVYVVTPQAMAVEGPPRAEPRGRGLGQLGDRHGRGTGQGDADRQHDPPAAGRGEVRAAGRRQPAAAAAIHQASIAELKDGLWPRSWSRSWNGSPCRSATTRRPTDAELRIAQAQLVGWLEGLFHGIQTALFAQQMAARAQLEQMRRALPPGSGPLAPEGPPPRGHRGHVPVAISRPHGREVREFSGRVPIFPGTARPGFPSHARPVDQTSTSLGRLPDARIRPTPRPARVRARCVELASVFQNPLLEEPLAAARPPRFAAATRRADRPGRGRVPRAAR